ncbi:MAG TPA: hypothetical protein VG965_03350 [Patescibacteria group bacterium]|nr:hypothetical protein [Patescibacteria group bacterium]
MKKIIFVFLISIFGILVGLIFMELVLRGLNAAHIISIDKKKSFANDPFVYSASLKYTIKPYFAHDCSVVNNPKVICEANKYGFRDSDHEFKKPANTFRILMIGDSLTYNPGVLMKDTYERQLQNILNKNNKTKKKIEIINLGMIFYGPQQYFNMYEQMGKKYDADLVIMSYHLFTDPYDAYEYEQDKTFYFYKSLPDIIPYSVSQPLKEHAYIFRTLLSAYYGWANRQDPHVIQKFLKDKMFSYQVRTQLDVNSPEMKRGWQLSKEYVGDLVKEAKNNHSKIAIVVFPAPAQIMPDEWKNLKKQGYDSDSRLYSDSQTRKKMSQICKSEKWTCLDLQDDLRAAPDVNKLFLKGDVHLTGVGNQIVAQSVFKLLKDKKYIN